MSTMSDHEPSSFDDAVREVAWVRRLALAIVHDAHAAEDVAQDAWLTFLRRRPDRSRGLTGWFRAVIRNRTRTLGRDESRRDARETLHVREELDPHGDPVLAMERFETQEELLRAVRELDEPYRTVVLLRWFEGLEPQEIARRTRAPVRTIHTRTTRALALLRERLDRDETWMSAWLPLLVKPSSSSLPILVMNIKLKVMLAAVLLLSLSGVVWVAMSPSETSAPSGPNSAPVIALTAEPDAVNPPHDLAPSDRSSIVPAQTDTASVAATGPSTVLVRVHDDLGPVHYFAARLIEPAHSERLRGLEDGQKDHLDDEARFAVDQATFVVQVYADMHAPLILGPFENAPGERVVDASLTRLPGIRGRVVFMNQPQKGATVSLHEAIAPGRRGWNQGLLVRSTPSDTAKGRSATDGTFALTLQKAGRFWLRADFEGLASAEIGPLDLDPKAGKDGLLLELTRGGSIEGVVMLAPGGSLADEPSGTFDYRSMRTLRNKTVSFRIVATRFDGFHHVVQPDREGRFRIDGLSPGPWLVLHMPPFALEGLDNDDGPGETPVSSNCEVSDGVVTHFDLDLRPDASSHLIVQVGLVARDQEQWKVRIATSAWQGPSVADDASLPPDGILRVDVIPGPAILHLTGKLAKKTALHMREQVVLVPGENTWSLDLPVGSVSGRVVHTNPHGKPAQIRLRWTRGALEGDCSVRNVAADGTFRLDGLPAGTWQATDASDANSKAISFVIANGGTTQVELSW